MANEAAGSEAPPGKETSTPSTLIEFPGSGRYAQPAWRKELSERVREIQERRARDAEREAHERQLQEAARAASEPSSSALGLVPQPDQPPLNPIVAAALKRIERAQQPQRTPVRGATRGASVAVARIPAEQFEDRRELEPPTASRTTKETQSREEESVAPPARRPHALSVVQPKLIADVRVDEVTTLDAQLPLRAAASVEKVTFTPVPLSGTEVYDDVAPFVSRVAAGVVDLMVIVFASSPFAAIIELTNGDWADERVLIYMGGIFALIMFLYLTSSTTIGGRTWGMSLFSLRAVDVESGLPPTTKQSVTRAVAYMLSLATFGLGIFYAIVDAERRAVHDHLSGTTVVRE